MRLGTVLGDSRKVKILIYYSVVHLIISTKNRSMFMQLHDMEILDLSSPINPDDDNLCGNFRGPDLPIVTLPS